MASSVFSNLVFVGLSSEMTLFVESLAHVINQGSEGDCSEITVFDINCIQAYKRKLYDYPHLKSRERQAVYTQNTIVNCEPLSQIVSNQRKRYIISSDLNYKLYRRHLADSGLTENVDFYYYRDMFAKLAKAHGSMTSILRVDHAITHRCTLNCTHCNMYVPYTTPVQINIKQLETDLQLLFSHLDFLGALHIVGGEPLLHSSLIDYLKIVNRFKGKIGQIWLTTNGTITPNGRVLDALKALNVRVNVSDYSDSVPRISDEVHKNILIYKEAGIDPYVDSQKDWKSFGDPVTGSVSFSSDYTLSDHFYSCTAPFRGLQGGRLHYCNIAASTEFIPELKQLKRSSFIDLEANDTRTSDLCVDLDTRDIKFMPPHCQFCNGCNTDIGNKVSPGDQGRLTKST